MKRIVIKEGSKAHEFFKEASLRKEEMRKRMDAMFPPEDIRQKMEAKVAEVDKQNDGTLDKSTFRLGMMCMWFLLNKEKDA